MGDLREHFATAGAPRNTWTGCRGDEQAMLGALGMADALGAGLWRLKYKGDPRVAKRCVVLMAERLKANRRWHRAGRTRGPGGRGAVTTGAVSASLLERLAFRVIFEWVNDRCTVCHGRGTVGHIGHVRACGHCKGACREPLQHAARARDMGVSLDVYRAQWEWRIARLLAELEALDEAVRLMVRGEISIKTVAKVLKLDPEDMTIAANAEGEHKSAA